MTWCVRLLVGLLGPIYATAPTMVIGWVVPASTKLPFPPHHHVVRQGDQPANLIISANKQTLGEHQIRSHGTLGH